MPESLNEAFLERVRAHRPTEAVRRRAEAAGMDLDTLRDTEPLTYAAANAVPLVRTDARLASQVSAVLTRLNPHHQLFTVPLTLQQTGTELRVFPLLQRSEWAAFDDALGALVGAQAGGLFYRTVGEASGERRELAWPLAPDVWQGGAALVGPFATEAEASAWGQGHADPRQGFVSDTLPYAGVWLCDVFAGE